jgi:glucose-6-phosphate isomerase
MIDLNIEKLSSHSLDLIDGLLDDLRKCDVPSFASHQEDISLLEEEASIISGKRKIIVIGHGGSITTFKGILGSVGRFNDGKEFFLVDTVDPVHLKYIKDRTSPDDTHVIAISKSGNTLTVLEALSVFEGYSTTAVTETGYGALRKIAKARGWGIVDVPGEIGGRFSGGTASAILPSLVLGIDVEEYISGLKEAYRSAREDDELINLSGAFYLVERVGKRTIFMPVYSKGLSAFNDLVTQLFHETLSKGRKGMTVLCHEGPECQHHTNQRILDGPEDVATLFVLVEGERGSCIEWNDIQAEYKGVPMNEMGGYDLRKAISSEASGVMGSMDELGAPYGSITLLGESEKEIGFYVGMMQYLAYYFAMLRKVNPFDQPAVEKAKEIALGNRKNPEME